MGGGQQESDRQGEQVRFTAGFSRCVELGRASRPANLTPGSVPKPPPRRSQSGKSSHSKDKIADISVTTMTDLV